MVVQWKPDSTGFLTGDYNGNICYWHMEEILKKRSWKKENKKFDSKQDPLIHFKGHKGFITSLQWRPYHVDSSCDSFVSSSKDMSLRFWSLA
jgi:WD40 repeat protein